MYIRKPKTDRTVYSVHLTLVSHCKARPYPDNSNGFEGCIGVARYVGALGGEKCFRRNLQGKRVSAPPRTRSAPPARAGANFQDSICWAG